MARRVAIVGGGITGLAAAWELERGSDAEIDLYEAAPTLGGKLRTDAIGAFLVEAGPDCFFSRKPGVLEMVDELGLTGELIAPLQREFAMLVDGTLHRVPGGLVTLTYSKPDAVTEATFLSDEAKARVLAEIDQPAGTEADESIRSFFDRRFGAEFTRHVAEPLLAGTHGGDPDRLSMRALYPGYFDLERRHGSLAGGMTAPKPDHNAADHTAKPTPSFLSFRGGMRTLVDALARSLTRTRLHLGAALDELPAADRTVVALPANAAARLLPGIGLEAIAHQTTTIATLAYRREDVAHPLEGTGFLVPPVAGGPLSGVTWSSGKWPGRAPEGTVLLRAFTRGDDVGAAVARAAEILGASDAPLLSRVDRWVQAQPQYEVGHLDRIAAIENRLPETILLAGTSYRGVGIPDALRQGRAAAQTLLPTL